MAYENCAILWGKITMKAILVILPLASIVFGILNGRTSEVSAAVLDKAGEAVTLAISLCGIMCFWCGLMRVAEKAGLTQKAAKLLAPVVGLLFKGLKKGGRAASLITMNLAANLLGLGNATTPLGISAMQAIAEETGCGDEADDNMIMLAVLNTASLQLIPATAAGLRAANGAQSPLDILPCVWITSAYSLCAVVAAAKLMSRAARAPKGGGS